MPHVELAIIGGGSGNTILGAEWAGREVALVDAAEHFGGTCLNAGCIPTKMLVRVADVTSNARDAAKLGAVIAEARVDWPAIRSRIFTRIDEASDSGETWRANQDGVHLIRERVRLTGDRSFVTDSGETYTADRLVLASGARPRPLGFGDDLPGVHTSETIMRIPALPKSLLVLGGGAIAAEFAHVFAALGTRVTIAIRSDRMLRGQDEAVSARYTELAKIRHDLRTDVVPVGIEVADSGLITRFDDGTSVESELVLNATGRLPNSDAIGADRFDVNEAGLVQTNDRLQVLRDGEVVEGVYALGDVTSPAGLKHVANAQARVVRAQLAGRDERDTLGPIPHAYFAGQEIASFGVVSQDAPNGAVVITRDYGSTAYGWALEDTTSFCRLVVGADGALLGAHILGPEASILLQPLVQAAAQGLGIFGVSGSLAREQYWPHPALSEVVENALLDAEKALRRASA